MSGTFIEGMVHRGCMKGLLLRVPSEKHPFARFPVVSEMQSTASTLCAGLSGTSAPPGTVLIAALSWTPPAPSQNSLGV